MAANIQHSNETTEHYTPEWLVESARKVFGVFDLDPASSPEANLVVRATSIYTAEDNGLTKKWEGTVFVNPPGGLVDREGRTVIRASKSKKGCTETGACGLEPGHSHQGVVSSAACWWAKFAQSGCPGFFLGFSVELLQSAQAFLGPQPLDLGHCIPSFRVPFDVWDGEGRVPGDQPTHSNIFLARGSSEQMRSFVNEFSQYGFTRGPR